MDDGIPEQGDSHASSSHEVSLEPASKRSEDLGKHSVETHFPKDRNCEICQRRKITRAPCRRRNGGAVLYAVVVQDLATQWIQAYPCKNKTSQETQRSLQKFLEPERKPKVIYTDILRNLAKLVKISPGIIARLHHTDRRLMVLQCAE